MTTATLASTAASLVQAVSRATTIPVRDLIGDGRGTSAEANARLIGMALCRQILPLSLDRVGKIFGRHGATVAHACRAVSERIVADQSIAELYAGLLEGREVIRPLIVPAHTEDDGNRITPALVKSPRRQAGIDVRTLGHIDELGSSALCHRLREAKEQRSYWDAARFRATDERDRLAAAARVQAWGMQITAIEARLQQLATAAA
jgi:hypothetical protein